MTKVEFDSKITLGGKAIQVLELREPLFKDIRMVSKAGDEISMQNQLIRRLSGLDVISDDEFDEIPYKEYKKISGAIEGFL